jgi:hypothetical protein
MTATGNDLSNTPNGDAMDNVLLGGDHDFFWGNADNDA